MSDENTRKLFSLSGKDEDLERVDALGAVFNTTNRSEIIRRLILEAYEMHLGGKELPKDDLGHEVKILKARLQKQENMLKVSQAEVATHGWDIRRIENALKAKFGSNFLGDVTEAGD